MVDSFLLVSSQNEGNVSDGARGGFYVVLYTQWDGECQIHISWVKNITCKKIVLYLMDEYFGSHLVESVPEVFYEVKHNHLECKFRVQIRYCFSALWHLKEYDGWRTKKGNKSWASFVRSKSIIVEFVKEQRVGQNIGTYKTETRKSVCGLEHKFSSLFLIGTIQLCFSEFIKSFIQPQHKINIHGQKCIILAACFGFTKPSSGQYLLYEGNSMCAYIVGSHSVYANKS